MKDFWLLFLPLFTTLSGFCQGDTLFYRKLAQHWAPVHYQSIRTGDGLFNTNALKGKSDSLSTIDFDRDWDATNNWDNLETFPTQPALYYYVAATSTHYFITYGYFHPRDWTRCNFFHFAQHENDLEGVILVIEKDSSKWGKLLLGYSVFHLSLKRYYYSNDSKKLTLLSSRFNAGTLENTHPVSYQQPRGHGIKLDESFFKPERKHCRYIPENREITTPKDKHYRLISFLDSNQLLDHRENEEFFHSDETIRGSHGEGANPPWLWTDWKDKRKHPDLQIFQDPAKYILIDCEFSSDYSTDYTYHPFLDIK